MQQRPINSMQAFRLGLIASSCTTGAASPIFDDGVQFAGLARINGYRYGHIGLLHRTRIGHLRVSDETKSFRQRARFPRGNGQVLVYGGLLAAAPRQRCGRSAGLAGRSGAAHCATCRHLSSSHYRGLHVVAAVAVEDTAPLRLGADPLDGRDGRACFDGAAKRAGARPRACPTSPSSDRWCTLSRWR